MTEMRHSRQVVSVSDTLSSGLSEDKGRLVSEMGGPTDNCTVETWNLLVWPRERGETHCHPVTAPVGGESREKMYCASRQTSASPAENSFERVWTRSGSYSDTETALVRGRGPSHERPGQRPVEKRGSTKKVGFPGGV